MSIFRSFVSRHMTSNLLYLTGDPLSAYDVDVVEEGHAIQEYLTLLASSTATSGN